MAPKQPDNGHCSHAPFRKGAGEQRGVATPATRRGTARHTIGMATHICRPSPHTFGRQSAARRMLFSHLRTTWRLRAPRLNALRNSEARQIEKATAHHDVHPNGTTPTCATVISKSTQSRTVTSHRRTGTPIMYVRVARSSCATRWLGPVVCVRECMQCLCALNFSAPAPQLRRMGHAVPTPRAIMTG